MKKAGLIISIVVILVLALFLVLFFNSPKSPELNASQSNSTTSPTNQPTQTSQNNLNIEIKDFAFSPSELRIKVGQKVTWTNYDSVYHTISSDEGSELDSSLLSEGQTYTHLFYKPGIYSYHCSQHQSMKAKIIVE